MRAFKFSEGEGSRENFTRLNAVRRQNGLKPLIWRNRFKLLFIEFCLQAPNFKSCCVGKSSDLCIFKEYNQQKRKYDETGKHSTDYDFTCKYHFQTITNARCSNPSETSTAIAVPRAVSISTRGIWMTIMHFSYTFINIWWKRNWFTMVYDALLVFPITYCYILFRFPQNHHCMNTYRIPWYSCNSHFFHHNWLLHRIHQYLYINAMA